MSNLLVWKILHDVVANGQKQSSSLKGGKNNKSEPDNVSNEVDAEQEKYKKISIHLTREVYGLCEKEYPGFVDKFYATYDSLLHGKIAYNNAKVIETFDKFGDKCMEIQDEYNQSIKSLINKDVLVYNTKIPFERDSSGDIIDGPYRVIIRKPDNAYGGFAGSEKYTYSDHINYDTILKFNDYEIPQEMLEGNKNICQKDYEEWVKNNPNILETRSDLEKKIEIANKKLKFKIFNRKSSQQNIEEMNKRLKEMDNIIEQGKYLEKRMEAFSSFGEEQIAAINEYLRLREQCKKVSEKTRKFIYKLSSRPRISIPLANNHLPEDYDSLKVWIEDIFNKMIDEGLIDETKVKEINNNMVSYLEKRAKGEISKKDIEEISNHYVDTGGYRNNISKRDFMTSYTCYLVDVLDKKLSASKEVKNNK